MAGCLLALLGAGCTVAPSEKPAASAVASWKTVSAGVDRYECPAAVCGSRLILYRFAKDGFKWRFANRAAPSTVEAWAKSIPSAIFVVNGIYFNADWQPTGLLVTGGQPAAGKKYEYEKSGLLELAPEVRVIDTAAEKFNLAPMTEAGQNFPLLIKNGVAVTAFKDAHAARRTFIGNDMSGNMLIGTTPEDAVTFVQTAKLLLATGVKWKNVLNLDGGTSTGFAARFGDWSETMNSIVQVPNIIVVEKK